MRVAVWQALGARLAHGVRAWVFGLSARREGVSDWQVKPEKGHLIVACGVLNELKAFVAVAVAARGIQVVRRARYLEAQIGPDESSCRFANGPGGVVQHSYSELLGQRGPIFRGAQDHASHVRLGPAAYHVMPRSSCARALVDRAQAPRLPHRGPSWVRKCVGAIREAQNELDATLDLLAIVTFSGPHISSP